MRSWDIETVYIDINKRINCDIIKFPDGQPHINIDKYIEHYSIIDLTCSLTCSEDIILLLECVDALDRRKCTKDNLFIPYLMGARFDRVMQEGDSFDLKVISKLINSCGFENVYLLDVHSDVSLAVIENSINISNEFLVKKYNIENSVLICPDAGAAKKIDKYISWNKNIKQVVYCNKTRDLSNGNIKLTVMEPDKCLGKNCVIIDDLCDGGGTFLAIANQIKPSYLTLIVTHGIFSKGVEVFENDFNNIIVTDSYKKIEHNIITQTNIDKPWRFI